MLVPAGFHIRSVSAGEFAADLAGRIADGPGGRAPDFAGREVMELADMARTWAGVRNKRRRVVGLPLPGKTTV